MKANGIVGSEKFSDEHVKSLVRKATKTADSPSTKDEMVDYIQEFSRDMVEFSNELSRISDLAVTLDDDVVEKLYCVSRELNVKLAELRGKYPV